MSASYGDYVRTKMYDPADGTYRNGVPVQQASSTRRWWARILDALFVLVSTGLIIGLALGHVSFIGVAMSGSR
jgi:hypothetical protein